jgi:GTP-binding protein
MSINPRTYAAQAMFIKSAPALEIAPEGDRPEFAFIGRSNVGKSSLLNMLMAKKLAMTSQTPGKTQLLNYYALRQTYWVDLPGYGYARAGKAQREGFAELITSYMEGRKSLVCVLVLIDLRLEPQKIDIEFMEYLMEKQIPFAMVFTKADKLAPTKVGPAVADYQNKMLDRWLGLPPAFATSAEKGLGKVDVLAYLEELETTALASGEFKPGELILSVKSLPKGNNKGY